MPANEHAVADVAAAILEGTPIDWPAAKTGATAEDRRLLEELRLLCTVADFHRHLPTPGAEPPAARDSESAQYWGRLRLIERVGGGTFGDVYRAWTRGCTARWRSSSFRRRRAPATVVQPRSFAKAACWHGFAIQAS